MSHDVPEFRYVDVNVLEIDSTYQREEKKGHIKTMKVQGNGFNPRLCNALIVHKRPGNKLFVVDGQQRLALAKQCGVPRVACLIWNTDEYNEPDIFVGLQTGKKLTKLEIFKAKLAKNDPVALELKEIVESSGFNIAKYAGDKVINRINSIECIEEIHRTVGGDGLRQVLVAINQCWPDAARKTDRVVIAGMNLFLKKYKDKIDIKTLISKWKQFSLSEVMDQALKLQSAFGGDSGTYSFAKALLYKYNTGKQPPNRLRDLFDGEEVE